MAQPFDLSQYQWEKRAILLFSPSPEDETYARQVRELANRNPGVQDRDLVIVHLFKNEGRVDERDLAKMDVAALRERYEVSEGFTFILIGKDGGVKRRSEEIVAAAELFAQIDSMPMRQREMREGN